VALAASQPPLGLAASADMASTTNSAASAGTFEEMEITAAAIVSARSIEPAIVDHLQFSRTASVLVLGCSVGVFLGRSVDDTAGAFL
jgi:hypothetical protein